MEINSGKVPYVVAPNDEYAQSANVLFHFVKKPEYLYSILQKRALLPRYCKEAICYLNLEVNGSSCPEIAVLQKCFCDIPFHKLTSRFQTKIVEGDIASLSEEEKFIIEENNTHPALYGSYGIALSKQWGETHHLQPVQYLNELAPHVKDFAQLFVELQQMPDLPDSCANDLLARLSFIKPLHGNMERSYQTSSGKNIRIVIRKNFHDEQEWRYVPSSQMLADYGFERVIANPSLLQTDFFLNEINEQLTDESYRDLWLDCSYDDIRYLIVPDAQARIDLLQTILSLPDDNFTESPLQKYILISKILVLSEIRKDW